MKEGYFLSFGGKFILNDHGYSGMLLVSVKRLQHGANGNFAYGRRHEFYRTPFESHKWFKPSRVAWKVSSTSNIFMLN